MEIPNVKLFNDDCFNVMSKLGNETIDLILTDLPYGVTACKWDTPIDLKLMWKEFIRIIKKNGNIVLTAVQPFSSVLVTSNLKMFRYEWIWEKPQGTNPMLAKFQPMRNQEHILVFSKKRGKYFPIMEEGVPYNGFESNDKKIGEVYGSLKSTHKKNYGTRYPKAIQKFKSERKGYHPTQKPVRLMEYLIKTYTEVNDTVLDITMGSGTTGIAAMNLDRKFIGIELEEKYYNICRKRIQEYNRVNSFFGDRKERNSEDIV